MAIYLDVARQLQSEIRQQFDVGEYLPAEYELANRFSINRHTLRRAVDELVRAGMLLRQQGRGTVVLNNRIEYDLQGRGRFSEALENLGLHPSTQILTKETQLATGRLAKVFGVGEDTELVRIDTLRRADELPVTLISHFLLADTVPDIALHYRGGSLHSVLETQFGFRLHRQQSHISAALPRSDEVQHLRCGRDQPLLIVASRNVIKGTDRVIEYSVSRCRADRFELRVTPHEEINHD